MPGGEIDSPGYGIKCLISSGKVKKNLERATVDELKENVRTWLKTPQYKRFLLLIYPFSSWKSARDRLNFNMSALALHERGKLDELFKVYNECGYEYINKFWKD